MMNIMADVKPEKIKLADGNEYELPAINLNTLANLEQTMGFGLSQLPTRMSEASATTMRLVIWALIKEKTPDISLEQVGELITLETMKEISGVLSKILALS